MLHESLNILTVSLGVFVEEIHQLIVLIFNLLQLPDQLLLSFRSHLGVLAEFLLIRVTVGLKLENSMTQTLNLFFGHHQVHVQLIILFYQSIYFVLKSWRN